SLNEFTPIIGTDMWIDLVNKGSLSGLEDPVTLNNSILPYWWKNMSFNQVQNLKEYARIKKRTLEAY
ncbi:MAG TPA: radical SAM protein, partial [Fervidobacterium sp.]|nr:radical SAM protein [Fervidobacterium sp.]